MHPCPVALLSSESCTPGWRVTVCQRRAGCIVLLQRPDLSASDALLTLLGFGMDQGKGELRRLGVLTAALCRPAAVKASVDILR